MKLGLQHGGAAFVVVEIRTEAVLGDPVVGVGAANLRAG